MCAGGVRRMRLVLGCVVAACPNPAPNGGVAQGRRFYDCVGVAAEPRRGSISASIRKGAGLRGLDSWFTRSRHDDDGFSDCSDF